MKKNIGYNNVAYKSVMLIRKQVLLISALIFVLIVGALAYFVVEASIKEIPEIEEKVLPAQWVSENVYYISPIDIEHLRSQVFEGSDIVIERELSPGSNYSRYIASYKSDGNKIFGLLTIPDTEMPEDGYNAIVFNHGYIPPHQYVTTEKYVAYVDSLARNGFVVFKIDLRGHGESGGIASGSYFSPGYTVDAINAAKSLQRHQSVNPDGIGIWGHSMAGNLALRAMEVSDVFKAGVIWAGAVYSYEDFAKYRISDNSYVGRREQPRSEDREDSSQVQQLRERPEEIDFSDWFWSGISLTQNLEYLNAPVQIHHAINDPVVNIGYSRDLATELEKNGKLFELHEYSGGGHNIESPYFETAMQRTVEFFKANL